MDDRHRLLRELHFAFKDGKRDSVRDHIVAVTRQYLLTSDSSITDHRTQAAIVAVRASQHLETVQWFLSDILRLTFSKEQESEQRAVAHALLQSACTNQRNDRLKIVEWLVSEMIEPVHRDDGHDDHDDRYHYLEALAQACGAGLLDVVEWLVVRFRITAEDLRRHGDNMRALCMACAEGKLEIVQWLVDRFDLTMTDSINDAIMTACTNGQLAVLQFLTQRFCAIPEKSGILSIACMNGHLDVAKWLVEQHFCARLSSDADADTDTDTDSSIRGQETDDGDHCCCRCRRREHGLDDVRDDDYFLFRRVCHQGHVHVARWLIEHFHLTADNVSAKKHAALLLLCTRPDFCREGGAANLTDSARRAVDDSDDHDHGVRRSTSSSFYGQSACDFARWFVDRFGFTSDNINGQDVLLLKIGCNEQGRREELVRWILTTFPNVRVPDNCAEFVAKTRLAMEEEDELSLMVKPAANTGEDA